MLEGVKKVHFIGIGGVGMSATAKLLKERGVAVTGSDEEVYEPMLGYLKREAFTWAPYKAENIAADVDLIVVGKNAKLTPETNAEVAAALASGKPIASYPEVLAELSKEKEVVVVAGSYGKSTSTALLAHCLLETGLDPSYWIPAVSFTPAVNAKLGAGNYFVVEGDEYPASNTDPRSKFLHYHSTHVLITPLAHDHINIFPTPADYLKPFYELAKLAKTVVACTDGPLSQEFLSQVPDATTYSLALAKNIVWGEKTSFDFLGVRIETTLLGEHNVQNIVGVGTLLMSLKCMTPEQFAKAVASFKGIARRLDRKSEKTSVPIYEGFGSSYEKLRSAIAAMKLHFPSRRLVLVFEPNTFSWRNRASLASYQTAFEGADLVYIFEPPHDGKDSQLSLGEMVVSAQTSGTTVQGAADAQDILAALGQELKQDDVVLLSSSGGLGGLVEKIPQLAEEKFPA